MAGKAGLKAGLIGAGVMLVLTLLSQIPAVGCVCCGLSLLAYAGIGALGGFFLTPPRAAGTGAGAGAVAGLISGAGTGIVWTIVMAIMVAIQGPDAIMAQYDPQQLRQLAELGIDRDVLAVFTGTGGVAIAGTMCCLSSLAVGAGLGAIGGAIFAAAKAD